MDDPISAWWRQFQREAPRISEVFSGKEDFNLPEWMNQTLGDVHPQLMWEFGPAIQGPGHRLVITPEGRKDLRPLAREVLRRAPRIVGWEFYEFRPAEDLQQAAASVEGRVGADLHELRFTAVPGDSHTVDLTFYAPGDWDPQMASHAGFVACESLLGEEVLDCWIGGIEAQTEEEAPPDAIPMAQLPAVVHRQIEAFRAQLPPRPWHQLDTENMPWSALELKPEEAEDYFGQHDLIVCITPALEVLQNALGRLLFDSRRHSRHGEWFCYLKIDGSGGLEQSEFADREEIENALNEVLRPAGLGSVIGGGTGLMYSYIELALPDVGRAWQAISTRLAEGRIPKRTWLLYHDAYYVARWHGLYDDTPAPPLPDFEG